ncbi:MAG: hypothetical protein AB7P04_02855 [Bacteriovoracia bacterium]
MKNFNQALAGLFTILALVGAAPAQAADGEHIHDWEFGAFVGVHSSSGHSSSAFGAELEYRLSLGSENVRNFGVGPIVEIATSSPSTTLLGLGVFIHAYKGWRIIAAPGLEIVSGGNSAIFRVGTGYDFTISDHVVVGPEIAGDFSSSHTSVVYGVHFGFGF